MRTNRIGIGYRLHTRYNTNGGGVQGQGAVLKPDKLGTQRKRVMSGWKGMGSPIESRKQ